MSFFKVKLHYFCLMSNHENCVTRYYRASDIEDVKRRFSLHYPCAKCPPDAVPHGRLEIDFEIEEISELAFELSDAQLEPEVM